MLRSRIEFKAPTQFFPADLREILVPYWERELRRLVHPLPNLKTVLAEMSKGLLFLKEQTRRKD